MSIVSSPIFYERDYGSGVNRILLWMTTIIIATTDIPRYVESYLTYSNQYFEII